MKRVAIPTILVLVLIFGVTAIAKAQTTGGQTTGGTTTGGSTSGGSTTGGQSSLTGGNINTGLDLGFDTNIENQRDAGGFAGVDEDALQNGGFVGAANSTGAGGGQGAGGRGAAGLRGQAAGANTSFEVIRSGLRTPLVNRIQFLPPSALQRESHFQSTLARLNLPKPATSTYNVRISNGTAVVTGSISSPNEAKRVIQMLRLEPGVYRIDNQLTPATPRN
ncbi:MAG: BON domain-containing protein [Pirellulaceae bacterium]